MDEAARQRVDLVERMMKVMGAKWKPAIMFCLVHQGKMRFGELRQAIPDVTQRILTLRLRELEADGLIVRHVINNIPPHVEYEVTTLGMGLHPIYRDICQWADKNKDQLSDAIERQAKKN